MSFRLTVVVQESSISAHQARTRIVGTGIRVMWETEAAF
jgi:hypothetical protein